MKVLVQRSVTSVPSQLHGLAAHRDGRAPTRVISTLLSAARGRAPTSRAGAGARVATWIARRMHLPRSRAAVAERSVRGRLRPGFLAYGAVVIALSSARRH